MKIMQKSFKSFKKLKWKLKVEIKAEMLLLR